MVLLILALVWAAVLGPGILRRRAERHNGDSIGAFHRQLRVLQRTGPSTVAPAHRLRSPRPTSLPFGGGYMTFGSGGTAEGEGLAVPVPEEGLSEASAGQPAGLRMLGSNEGADRTPGSALARAGELGRSLGGTRASPDGRRPDPYFLAEACRRRRNVLLTIVSVLAGSGLLGLVPALHLLLVVTVVSALALAGYIALLVYLRVLADERRAKLHYFPAAPGYEAEERFRRVAAR